MHFYTRDSFLSQSFTVKWLNKKCVLACVQETSCLHRNKEDVFRLCSVISVLLFKYNKYSLRFVQWEFLSCSALLYRRQLSVVRGFHHCFCCTRGRSRCSRRRDYTLDMSPVITQPQGKTNKSSHSHWILPMLVVLDWDRKYWELGENPRRHWENIKLNTQQHTTE